MCCETQPLHACHRKCQERQFQIKVHQKADGNAVQFLEVTVTSKLKHRSYDQTQWTDPVRAVVGAPYREQGCLLDLSNITARGKPLQVASVAQQG